jgi:23S rRNA (uracil1939-C5)-methyltransferase
VLKPFFLRDHAAEVDSQWRHKTLMAAEVLGQAALRHMRPDAVGARTRLDLMWNGEHLGVRGPSKNPDSTYHFARVEKPDSVSAGIVEMMERFESSKPPLDLAQIRFREGNGGERGIWIDSSNENIKSLLDERTWLGSLLERGWIVEVGQKHKQVAHAGDGLKLVAATARCWLPSFNLNNDPIELVSYVSLFSQPGPEVNRALIAAGLDLLDESHVREPSWVEWGAGYGNLTAAYATRLGAHGFSSEIEAAAADLLEQNARKFFPEVTTARAAAEKGLPWNESPELWLIDPPRPGFGKLLETLSSLESPPHWVLAYHCHATGLINDARVLKSSGYRLEHWSSVDAFPATPHHEVVSLWKKQ